MSRCAVRRFFVGLVCVVVAGAYLGFPAAAKSDDPDAPIQPRIVNGLLTHGFYSTGILLDSANPSQAALICSGTMIGCDTFLTAAHCVEDSLNPSHYGVFLQHAGFFAVSSVTIHPSYSFPVADVAVLKLTQPVTGVAPTAINTVAKPAFGTSGVIAGFGRTSGTNDETGLKYYGNVSLASCSGAGVSDTTSVCWQFSDPLGAPGSNSNTCNGDSGGPLFVDMGAGPVVAGVTSGGISDDCMPTDQSFDTNVHHYRTWIEQLGGADLTNTTCGSIPQAGGPDTVVYEASGVLNSSNRSDDMTFVVPSGTTQFRVAMNAVDDFGTSDFDLYVRFGSPATTTTFDCKADGVNQLGFCQFNNPTAGTWHVHVNRFRGAGTYQVTATAFGADCSGCPPPTPTPAASHDVAVAAIKPAKVSITAGATSRTRTVRVKVANADPRGSAAQLVTLHTDDGDCPAGTMGSIAFRSGGSSTLLEAGKSATAQVVVVASAAQFTAGGSKSPGRCTAVVSATGAGNDPTPSNNAAALVIDVFDRNDY